MTLPATRQIAQVVAFAVWGYHLVGAARTFSPPKGQRPSPRIHVFSIAIVILVNAVLRSRLETRLMIPGFALFIGSVALFEWARHSVRGKYFSYIYSKDTPQFLWTSGPYAYIRNPFYTSYMLSYIGASVMFPGAVTFAVVGMMILYFNLAVRHEERKFEHSELAVEYTSYRRRTGRFLPKLRSEG